MKQANQPQKQNNPNKWQQQQNPSQQKPQTPCQHNPEKKIRQGGC